jgi:Ca2+-binding EF-hand superfamily protein
LKGELKSRGAHGIHGLGRKFKIMDDDGSKSLSMAEFKKAMRECNLKDLNDSDLRNLFNHFDKDGSGSISFDEFLNGIRDPMNERRVGLVRMAFAKVDKDGSGILDAADILDVYDASKHPEVIAGRMTQDQVFREFIDNFDVGGEKDGMVSPQEFENYYANVSASIDNDDYFELMIRNAWHISGGEGWCANSSNARVLVTHADGSQSVEEIKDDLGVTSDQYQARLLAQGINATKIDTKGGVEDEDSNKGGSLQAAANSRQGAANKRNASSNPITGSAATASPTRFATPGRDHRSKDKTAMAGVLAQPECGDSPVSASTPRSATQASSPSVPDAGLSMIITKLKAQLKARGANGIIGLGRKFKIMDDDGSKTLNMAEFKKAMNECALDLKDSELRMMFVFFDKDSSGSISFDEFLNGVRDPMNKRRRDLVQLAFTKIDIDGNGILEASDVVHAYDASKHPDVIAGKKTADDVFRDFLDNFDVGGEKDGCVTPQEFENYYQAVSASIDNDDYFELMIRNAWHISGGEGWCANSSNARVLVTHADGSQSVEEIKNDLGVTSDQYAAKLRGQGINATKIDTKGGVEDEDSNGPSLQSAGNSRLTAANKRNASSLMLGGAPPNAPPPHRGGNSNPIASNAFASSTGNPVDAVASPNGRPGTAPAASGGGNLAEVAAQRAAAKRAGRGGGGGGGGGGSGASTPMSLADMAASKKATTPKGPTSLKDMAGSRGSPRGGGVTEIVTKLKAQLKARGASGIVGLGRKFRIMDDDGSKSLDMGEFKKAMRECALDLNEQELSSLFRHFDRDGGGSIGYEEFLSGVRGVLNPRRLKLVRLAFTKIDADGNGILEASDVVHAYDASKHPDVISGKKTADDVFREFLDNFDVGGVKDGCVTPEEFESYYSNVSASIDNDDYFELMIRNAWHISGGEGWCANSSNARVLVTHADGRQTVEEIKDDLGVKSDQYGARLRQQGINATKIDTKGGVEDEDSNKGGSLQAGYAQRPATAPAASSAYDPKRATSLW